MLQWDTEYDEPYIPLGDGIRITPLRFDDVETWWELYSEKGISDNNIRNPKPLPRELAERQVVEKMETARPFLGQLQALRSTGTKKKVWVIGGCPFHVIRNDSGKIIDVPFPPPEPLSQYAHVNQTWDLGYNVSSQYTGRGIAKAAVKGLVDDWCVPFMRLRRISAGAKAMDEASHAVLRKAGLREVFRYPRTLPQELGGVTFEAIKFVKELPPSLSHATT
ncbi:hypothetical protein M231_06234 [Tremella mesenterica]|uniref:N-acetyltransferase domain-containing protein n=1 Tax=Tremella mesenterica TaxID=5217 RepID=A0A4Q1BCF9_TREME|nr:hypothetical protein M231_06234 [Tremella mesenterica]